MTWPLARDFASGLPSDLADPVLNAWVPAWDADRLRHGLQGLWDAPVLFPHRRTLAHTDALLGIAFFSAPIQWLTDNPVAAYNFGFLFSYVLAGTGMYVLALEICGRRDAALLAAAAFGFSPFRADHPGHLQVLTAGWMPLALWGLHRCFRAVQEAAPRRRWLTGRPQTGVEWLGLQLDRHRDIGRLVLWMAADAVGDDPRELIVEASGGDGVVRALFRGSVLAPLIRGLVRDGRHPRIWIDLPPNDTLRLRLRQAGSTHTWGWALPELEVWERQPGAAATGGP